MGPDDFNDLALDDINEAGENNGELDEASAVNLSLMTSTRTMVNWTRPLRLTLSLMTSTRLVKTMTKIPRPIWLKWSRPESPRRPRPAQLLRLRPKLRTVRTEERQSTGPRKKGGKGSQGQGGHINSLDGKIHSTETKAKLKRLINTDPDLTNEHGLILWSKVRKHFPQKQKPR